MLHYSAGFKNSHVGQARVQRRVLGQVDSCPQPVLKQKKVRTWALRGPASCGQHHKWPYPGNAAEPLCCAVVPLPKHADCLHFCVGLPSSFVLLITGVGRGSLLKVVVGK